MFQFTEAQKVDLRRYMGYGVLGGGNSGQQSYRFFIAYGSMEWRLANLSPEEGAVVIDIYLSSLNTLESDILSASANLDTDRAAVWYHNKSEVGHRERLFDDWRRRLCQFLGLPPGPGLLPGGQMARVV